MSSWTAASSDCSRPVNIYVHVKTADLYRPNARLTPERQGYQVLTPFGKLGYSHKQRPIAHRKKAVQVVICDVIVLEYIGIRILMERENLLACIIGEDPGILRPFDVGGQRSAVKSDENRYGDDGEDVLS